MQMTTPFLNQVDPEFWRGKRVFVTGHTRFQGSWLCLWLQYLGAQVAGYAIAPHGCASLFTVARVADGMTSIMGDLMGDLCQGPTLTQAMVASQPEIVLHVAENQVAEPSLGSSAVSGLGGKPQCEMDRETMAVLESVQQATAQAPVRSLVILTAATDRPATIPAHIQGQLGEVGVALAMIHSRPGIGGGDDSQDRVVPQVMRALGAGQAAVLPTPQTIDTGLHVLESLNGVLLLAERLYAEGAAFAETFCLGSDARHCETHEAIATQLCKLWGCADPWQPAPPLAESYTAAAPLLDTSAARDRLGWRIVLDLKTSLKWVVDWSKAVQAGADGRALSLQHIRDFMALTQASQYQRTLADAARDPAMMQRLRFCC